jgi:branched-chain amino acid transport system ATP-binding protein
VVSEIFRALARLNSERGVSILLAEQNASVALRHAHRAVVLESGRVTVEGSAADLRRRDDIRAAYLGFEKPPSPRSLDTERREAVI